MGFNSGFKGLKDVKRQWRDADHSPSSSDEAESEWSYNLHPAIYLHSMHMNSFTAYSYSTVTLCNITGELRDLYHLYRDYTK